MTTLQEVSEIEKNRFEPQFALGTGVVEFSRKELCEFVAAVCRQIRAESGDQSYNGGVFPQNISVSPDGRIGIGSARDSEWEKPELDYIAPEIYWDNRPSPQSDIYALGLLLYYGASAGRLPFEGESSNAQLMRMSGKTIHAPSSAGKHLGDIIEKALQFKESDRYGSLEEMAMMLDYCEDRRLFDGASSIFRKPGGELSEMEKMMVDIIEDKSIPTPEPQATGELLPGQNGICAQLSEEELFTEAGLHRPVRQDTVKKEKNDMKDLFGLDDPDPRDPSELEEEEVVRVYEPSGKQGIPILTEEKDPELAPVTVKARKSPAKQRQQQRKQEASPAREYEEEENQKKRPLLVVFLLLAVLLIAAVVAKILIDAFAPDTGVQNGSNVSVVTPSVQETEAAVQDGGFDVSAILSEEQIRYQQEQEELARQRAEQEAAAQAAQQQAQNAQPEPVEEKPHTYEAVRADVGWLEARDAAISHGGRLVTINSAEELAAVVQLAEQAGFDRIWIGGHRENGEITWESGETDVYYNWDEGEPSYTDSGDGASEDYILLWFRNGKWVYNDSRENPLTEFYGMYGGRIGYVVEITG